MKSKHVCTGILMASGILSFAGCSLWGPESTGEAQFDHTLESESKSLAGVYRDIGSDGSIQPHPESSNRRTQEPQDGADGLIMLGSPVDMPDVKTGTSTIEGSIGGTTAPRSGFGSKNPAPSSGARGTGDR
jgi:hypothetical protein